MIQVIIYSLLNPQYDIGNRKNRIILKSKLLITSYFQLNTRVIIIRLTNPNHGK
jgi:hypothetical protein